MCGIWMRTAKHGQAARRKHVPQRTCVGCRQTQGKRDMIRVVRAPEGQVQVDPTGKRPGRGAYVHSAPDCWRLALKDNRLELALKTALSAQDRAALAEFAETLAI